MNNYDPTNVIGMAEDKLEADAKKRLARETEISDIEWLMKGPRGRRIVWRLLSASGVFRLSFDPNAAKMAFNEGRRAYGNQMLDELMNICPDLFQVMWQEHQPKEQHDGSGKQNGSGGK